MVVSGSMVVIVTFVGAVETSVLGSVDVVEFLVAVVDSVIGVGPSVIFIAPFTLTILQSTICW